MHESRYRAAMIVTLAIGVWEGPLAIVFRLFTDKGPSVLTAANYLPTPWCYLAAIAATAAALGVLAFLSERHKALPAVQ